MESPHTEALSLRGITKVFPGVLANDDVNLSARRGEILAILGENGAGKSTLVKILYGMYQPDSGTVSVNGRAVGIRSPKDALALGIGMIHQHFTLVPVHTVWENVVLGLDPSSGRPAGGKGAALELEKLGRRYGLEVDPFAVVADLSVGMQQKTEILKALYRSVSILVLDEPTAVLTPGEADNLFGFLREFRAAGNTVLFITHKLGEVMEIADRIEVLRGGRNAGSFLQGEVSERELAARMVGGDIPPVGETLVRPAGRDVLEVRDLWVRGSRGHHAVRGVSFTVRAGEILGIAGVSGNGQEELADCVCGLARQERGEIRLDGRILPREDPGAVFRAGVGYIPADRHREGLVLDMTVEENLVLKNLSAYSRKGFLREGAMRKNAERLIGEYGIRPPLPGSRTASLSGGNQQKVVAAREIEAGRKCIVAVQPTRGLDLGAAAHVHRMLAAARNEGRAILLVSTELSEVVSLSDTVAVMSGGEIAGIFPRESADLRTIGLLMAGRKGEPS
ncbi:MAG TPA: ABC transporter ATP-binding protein [Aminivibrio sp.]|uniref:ABC transporter ATP-binding protein n=1 Tax=Aminivibrio sp. TaxID=1872489 RepID=UPI002CB18880|nr:ABC transporter ATP-binding protein [Aminivibrio sp.]HPF85359.1 ABC transporter ATP-binding protein [Aminivibrio sp.]